MNPKRNRVIDRLLQKNRKDFKEVKQCEQKII